VQPINDRANEYILMWQYNTSMVHCLGKLMPDSSPSQQVLELHTSQ